MDNLLELINVKCKMVNFNLEEERALQDKKDLFILGMAKDIPADYIVTGDKDILILKSYKNTKILTFTDFYTLIHS